MSKENSTASGMVYNKITLAFPKENEVLFLKKYYTDSIIQFRIAFVFVTLLYSAFGFLDLRLVPEYANTFLAIRFYFVVPLLIVVLILSFTPIFHKVWQTLMLVSFVVAGTGIGVMTMLLPENYFYYAGMMLVFSAGYFFIKLRFFKATIAGWTTLLIFNLGSILYSDTTGLILLSFNFFFISANLIGMFAAYYIEYYARRDFYQKQELDSQKDTVDQININLEKIVAERTKELVRAKDEAEESRSKTEALLNAIPDLMFIQDIDGVYLDYHAPKSMMLYAPPEVFLGKNMKEVLPPEIVSEFKKVFDNAIRTRNLQKYEYSLIMPAGLEYYEGRVISLDEKRVLSIIRDITARKLAEEYSILKNAELQKINAEKDKFFSIISHDLLSPFNGFLGLTQLMVDELPDLDMDEVQKIAVSLKNSATNLFRLLENLLQWARMNQGLIPFNPEIYQIVPIVEESITMLMEPARNKGIKLVNNIAPEVVVFADKDILYSVFRNLISNAIKFTPKGGSVEISARYTSDKKLEISIKDSGIGMNSTMIENLFRPDVQTNRKGTEGEPSTGLGLLLCKEFIKKLGGKIWVTSEEDKGSVFSFTLNYTKYFNLQF